VNARKCTKLVYNGAMSATKHVRRSVSLPAPIAKQVDRMAKTRRLSDNRVLVELIELGIEARKQKERRFLSLLSVSAPRAIPNKRSVWATSWAVWFSVSNAGCPTHRALCDEWSRKRNAPKWCIMVPCQQRNMSDGAYRFPLPLPNKWIAWPKASA